MRRTILVLCILVLTACAPKEKENNHVYVIAKTPEAAKFVNEIVEINKWQPTKESKNAKHLVVVIQTGAVEPLDPKFPTVHDLETAADNKIDRSSMSYVIYTYKIDEKGQPVVVEKNIKLLDPTQNYHP